MDLVDLKRVRWEGPELGSGKHTLEFAFKYDGLGAGTLAFGSYAGFGQGGTGVLKVDGTDVATEKMEHTLPFILHWDEALDIASHLKLSGYSATIAKASCYGGKFRVAPDARLTDPSLYLFITHGKRKVDLLRYVLGILLRRHLSLRDISYVRSGKVSVEGDAHLQIDGDYAGTTPAQIEVVPDALRLVMKAPLRG